MSDKPGSISTFFAILGIVAYLISDLFAVAFVENYLQNPVSFSDALGQVIGSFFLLAFALIALLAGTLFALLGQIWKQRRAIAIISTLCYGLVCSVFFWLTYDGSNGFTTSIDTNLLILLVSLLIVLALHIKGVLSSN